MGVPFSAWGAFAQMQVAHDKQMTMEAEATSKALSYENRQMALTGGAAAAADVSLIPGVGEVTMPISLALTALADFDTLAQGKKLSYGDLLVTALGSARQLATLAETATELKEAGEVVKTGQEFLHAGAATLAAGAAAVELRSPSNEQAQLNAGGARGHQSGQANANGAVSIKYTPIGSRIPRTVTCDAQGNCSSN